MRETRSYGSARGVRSNPYPYRDTLTPRAQHGKKTSPPPPHSGSTKKPSLTVPDSPHSPVKNRESNQDRIGQLN